MQALTTGTAYRWLYSSDGGIVMKFSIASGNSYRLLFSPFMRLPQFTVKMHLLHQVALQDLFNKLSKGGDDVQGPDPASTQTTVDSSSIGDLPPTPPFNTSQSQSGTSEPRSQGLRSARKRPEDPAEVLTYCFRQRPQRALSPRLHSATVCATLHHDPEESHEATRHSDEPSDKNGRVDELHSAHVSVDVPMHDLPATGTDDTSNSSHDSDILSNADESFDDASMQYSPDNVSLASANTTLFDSDIKAGIEVIIGAKPLAVPRSDTHLLEEEPGLDTEILTEESVLADNVADVSTRLLEISMIEPIKSVGDFFADPENAMMVWLGKTAHGEDIVVKLAGSTVTKQELLNEYKTYRALPRWWWRCLGLYHSRLGDWDLLVLRYLGPSLLQLKARGEILPNLDGLHKDLRSLHRSGIRHGDVAKRNVCFDGERTYLVDLGECTLVDDEKIEEPVDEEEKELLIDFVDGVVSDDELTDEA